MDVRASDDERDATIELLREAAAQGRLTFEELAERIEAASSAVMRAELVPLTADLPGAPVAGPVEPATGVRWMGDIKRSGAWVVPPELDFRSYFGNIKLDFRDATITTDEIRVHAWAGFGNVDLLVPEGVEVEVQANPLIGKLKQEGGPATPGAARIILTGGAVLGDVKIRRKKRRLRLLKRG
jgi:hypothetical protein